MRSLDMSRLEFLAQTDLPEEIFTRITLLVLSVIKGETVSQSLGNLWNPWPRGVLYNSHPSVPVMDMTMAIGTAFPTLNVAVNGFR